MPIQFQCLSCRSTLRVPDNLAGRKVRCPKCGGVVDVGPAPATAASLVPVAPETDAEEGLRPLPESERVHIRARKPISANEDDDAEEMRPAPPRPIRSQPAREEAISARPLRQTPPPEAEEEDEEEDLPRPRRFKRRKRRRPKKSTIPLGWSIVRWIAAAVVYAIVGSTIAIHMVYTGHTGELILDAIEWAIMMPISLVLFFISMFIGSAIAGGIDFGDVRTAIPKAIFLLAPINLFHVLFNWYLASFMGLPFWIFGLILLFGLDVWESWFMIVINWFLNVGAGILVILIVVAMMARSAALEKDEAPPDEFGDDQIVAPVQKVPDNLKGRLRK